MPRKPKLPKGWPLKNGRPATVEEIRAYIAEGDAHFNTPTYPTDCHFCQFCTSPLEFEPCPCCKKHRWEPFRAKLVALPGIVV